jgi:protein subunit release factor A
LSLTDYRKKKTEITVIMIDKKKNVEVAMKCVHLPASPHQCKKKKKKRERRSPVNSRERKKKSREKNDPPKRCT